MTRPDTPDLGEVLYQHPKPGGRTFRVAVREYRGRRFLDVREWGERDGKPLATARGATVPCEALESIADALQAYRTRNAPNGGPGAL
jgi:hypothetical protein